MDSDGESAAQMTPRMFNEEYVLEVYASGTAFMSTGSNVYTVKT